MESPKTTPRISIILPTHNGGSYIAAAIKSVVDQSFTDWELLVIDDGSTDNTKHIVESIMLADAENGNRMKYIQNEKNLGIQKTLNRGIREARGSLIARIDDDDIWNDPTKLAKQVGYLEANPDCVLVGTGTIIVDENSKELIRYLVPQTDAAIRSKLLSKNCFVHSSVVFKKEAALSVGGYDETVNTRHVEDYDLWLKLGTIGKLANVPLYAVTFMLRSQSLSSKNKFSQAKKGLSLTIAYRKKYPHFLASLMRSFARLIVYGIIARLPLHIFVNKIAKYYKERW